MIFKMMKVLTPLLQRMLYQRRNEEMKTFFKLRVKIWHCTFGSCADALPFFLSACFPLYVLFSLSLWSCSCSVALAIKWVRLRILLNFMSGTWSWLVWNWLNFNSIRWWSFLLCFKSKCSCSISCLSYSKL